MQGRVWGGVSQWGRGLGEGCALLRKFLRTFILKCSFGAFWVVFYVIESFNYKIAKSRTVADVGPEKRVFRVRGRVLVSFGRVQYRSGTNFKMTDYKKLSIIN